MSLDVYIGLKHNVNTCTGPLAVSWMSPHWRTMRLLTEELSGEGERTLFGRMMRRRRHCTKLWPARLPLVVLSLCSMPGLYESLAVFGSERADSPSTATDAFFGAEELSRLAGSLISRSSAQCHFAANGHFTSNRATPSQLPPPTHMRALVCQGSRLGITLVESITYDLRD